MKINDSKIIEMFEETVASFSGSQYGIATSSNTNGIFLSIELLKHKGLLKEGDIIEIPKRTYMSVPMSILNARMKVKFREEKWSGAYQLKPTPIWDSAVRFTRNMFVKGSLYCVSFQYRKGIPIGSGGMILTDSKEDRELLRKMRFNGRTDGVSQADDVYTINGWNMYFLPEQAARGLTLMTLLPEKNKDIASWQDYPDLSKQEVFK